MNKTDEDLTEINRITEKIIGCAIEVHRIMGPGLLESIYEECLAIEFELNYLAFERQKSMGLTYKGHDVGKELRVDFLVESKVIVELKSVEAFVPIHYAQTLSYLNLTNLQIGLLINFNVPVLKSGIKRLLNKYYKKA